MSEIKPIPEKLKRSWRVKIEGKPPNVCRITLTSKYGKLVYGLRQGQKGAQFDSWIFFENNGGGPIAIFYAYTPDKDLLIGLVLEERPNISEKKVLCSTGGFVDPEKSVEEQLEVEAREETGIRASWRELEGQVMASNRSFFGVDLEKREGHRTFAAEVPYEHLERTDDAWVYGKKHLVSDPESQTIFLPWREAIRNTPDGFARAGIAMLLADLDLK